MIAEKFGVGQEYVSMVRHGRYVNHAILTELILIATQEQKKRKAIIKKAEAAIR